MMNESPARRRATLICILVSLILGLAVVDEVIAHRMALDEAFIGFIVAVFFISVAKEYILRQIERK